MIAIRYIFLGALVFNMLVLCDAWMGGGRLVEWPTPTISEMCLLAIVVLLTRQRKTIVYGNGRYVEREHCEV